MSSGVPPPPPGGPGTTAAAAEVRKRAASGAALLGARGALVYGLGTVANLALARLLAPHDFGLVALGAVVLALGTVLSDGGFGAALIQRSGEPEEVELRVLAALQLAVTGTAAIAVAGAALAVGGDGVVIAVMVVSLPIAILRVPTVVVVERRLEYRVIATADVAEAVAYYTWAVGGAALGFGVWAMATGVIVRAVVGTSVVLATGPLGFMRPSWSWPLARPLLGFGMKVQAASVVAIVREQGLNVVVAAVGGIVTLGIWNLAWRVIQIPNVLFQTVTRVGFPTLSRLLGGGHDVRLTLERGIAAIAVISSIALVALGAAGRAVPVLAGGDWGAVPAVLLWASAALIVGAPVVTATWGYLYASNEAGRVALTTLFATVVLFVLSALLLPSYGAPGVGVAWVASALVNAGLLLWNAAVLSDARLLRSVAPTTAVALASLALGWEIAHRVEGRLAGAAVGALAAELLLLAGLSLVNRAGLRDTRALAGQAFGSFRVPFSG